MSKLADQIETKRAELSALVARASLNCAEGRHDWQHYGGCNAGCDADCRCSVPVHRCTSCGDYDYGENAEAERVRRACEALREQS